MTTTTTGVPTFQQSTALVMRREIVSRLRSKAFLISTGILLAAVLVSIVLGAIVGGSASEPKVAVVNQARPSVASATGLEQFVVRTEADALRMVRDHEVDAAIVPDAQSPLGITVIGDDSTPDAVVEALAQTPHVRLLHPQQGNGFLTYFVGLGFGLVFFMSSLTFGQAIAQSVVEEKQTRVVEILIAAIPVRSLYAGKVLGNAVLALGQILAITLLATAGLAVTGQTGLVATLGPSLVWFAIFFVVGFLLIASVYAALAALVSRQEDVAAATTPATIIVMVPYFLILIFSGNRAVLAVMSYIPFASTVGMPMRIFLGAASWWEPVLSLLVLAATTAGVILVGARIYENSLLRTGAKVRLREAFSTS